MAKPKRQPRRRNRDNEWSPWYVNRYGNHFTVVRYTRVKTEWYGNWDVAKGRPHVLLGDLHSARSICDALNQGGGDVPLPAA